MSASYTRAQAVPPNLTNVAMQFTLISVSRTSLVGLRGRRISVQDKGMHTRVEFLERIHVGEVSGL